MKRISLFFLNLYKLFFSSLLKNLFGGGCCFSPTCSEYSHEAIANFGMIKGTALTIGRISRCHPFSKGGVDPVPAK